MNNELHAAGPEIVKPLIINDDAMQNKADYHKCGSILNTSSTVLRNSSEVSNRH